MEDKQVMKINLHRVNYDGSDNSNGRWWVWKEICDKCGKVVLDENVLHSFPGDESELDFCVDCYHYLLENNIPYGQAIVLYGKNENA